MNIKQSHWAYGHRENGGGPLGWRAPSCLIPQGAQTMDAEKDEEVAKWHKLGPVDSDRLTQPWKYGFVWVPFFITTSPLHASKWVVNRYFDNCEPLVNRYCQQVEKGANSTGWVLHWRPTHRVGEVGNKNFVNPFWINDLSQNGLT